MRKLTALAIAIFMTVSFTTVPLFAANITQDTTPGAADSLIIYELAEQYNVTVPSEVVLLFDIETKEATEVDCQVSATGFIGIGRALSVTVESDNYTDSWRVVLPANDTVGISYGITDSADQVIANGDEVLSLVSGDTAESETLSFIMTGTPTMAGEFRDSLTFTVTVDNVSSN